jgi:hypothetical protein
MKVLRPPFFQRYGVNLPSSLTEGRSFTWGDFPLPTSVGLRYGRMRLWLEAFLGGMGADDFRTIARARYLGHGCKIGICLDLPLLFRYAHPVQSMGSPSLPRPLITLNDTHPVQEYLSCLPSPTTITSWA